MTQAQPDLSTLRSAGAEAWHRARGAEQQAAASAPDSREARMDLQRRSEVLERQAQSMRDHVPGAAGGAPRVVVALRQEWLARRVSEALAAAGLDVRACVVDGADAVGTCVAEQPDLLLIEDVLQRMTGIEVLAAVQRFSPGTDVLVQVAGPSVRQAFLAAGARETLPRGAAPAVLAAMAHDLLAGARQPALV